MPQIKYNLEQAFDCIIRLYQINPSFMEKLQTRQQYSTGVQVNTPSKVALKHIKFLENKNVPQSFVPFVFKNKRQKKQDNFQPAPGQYESKSNFDWKNQRDNLQENFNVVLENTRKIKESVFFKSKAKRFNYKQKIDIMSIRPSYRLSEHASSKSRSDISPRLVKIKNKTMTNMNEHKVYPSIPDKTIKFGYSLGEMGKLQKIQKSEKQLMKQKEDMKEYIKNLKILQGCDYMPSSVDLVKEKKSLIDKLKQRAHQQIYNKNCMGSLQKSQKTSKSIKKPLKLNVSKCNQSKVKNILQQKRNIENNLGPGCYEIQYDEKKSELRPQRYQFFSSSSQRFPQYFVQNENQTEKLDVKDMIKKVEIENKILNARKTRSDYFRKGLKKPQRLSHTTERKEKDRNYPGPCDYEPNQKFVKIDVGKASAFNRSNRFNLMKKTEDCIVKSQSLTLWQMQRDKQNVMKKLGQQMGCKKSSQKYAEMMRKNKQMMVRKKQEMQSVGKKKHGNKASDYEICSWDPRPLSRNDCSSKNKQLFL